MRRAFAATVGAGVALASILLSDAGRSAEAFSPSVDERGGISLPEDFRSWRHLGTWAVDGDAEDGGASGFHVVYARPETVAAFKATGGFPDGAVLVKELFKTRTDDYTTGRVSRAAEVEGWFVMIKDVKSRFAGHPLWGDGWGWALFQAEDPGRTVTKDYKDDCLACHEPVRAKDLIYLEGYPSLER